MKRNVFVPALVLALLIALCGDAFSRNHPHSYRDPGTGGDDHTWGGDQSATINPDDPHDGLNGGYTPLEIYITHIFFKWLGFNSSKVKTDGEADYIIQHRIDTTTPEEPVNTNVRGNL